MTEAVDSNWWPEPIPEVTDTDFIRGNRVIVAEVTEPWGPGSYRHVYTALAPPDLAEKILAANGNIGHEVSATGPHPSISVPICEPAYQPRFWIWASSFEKDGLEPLVVAWGTGPRIILVPDPGFLMTYALVPRQVVDDTTEWDDRGAPQKGVVVCKSVSLSTVKDVGQAHVMIDREYLQDYASIRNKTLLHVYYGHARGPVGSDTKKKAGEKGATILLPGRSIDLHVIRDAPREIHARVWGVRRLLDPGPSPITVGRWDYPELTWPGYDEPITDAPGSPPGIMPEVFVRDTVLAEYEDKPDFDITPQSGSVSCGDHWAVSHCHRLGRDLISLEVKKLYSGTSPAVVEHWHMHAVDPPTEADFSRLRDEANVAERAERIVWGIVGVGEALGRLASEVLQSPVSSKRAIGWDRATLEYEGWWTPVDIEPTTRHIPLNMTQGQFLDRCEDLAKVAIEPIPERILRRLLIRLGATETELEDLRSLGLLERTLQLLLVSERTGISLLASYPEAERRRSQDRPATPLTTLRKLNELRQLEAHRSSGGRLGEILRELGMEEAQFEAGWGTALDRVYDLVGEALEGISGLLDTRVPYSNPTRAAEDSSGSARASHRSFWQWVRHAVRWLLGRG